MLPCSELSDDYHPPLTFIVCQKRHHTRFFPVDGNTDRSGNCLPGTGENPKPYSVVIKLINAVPPARLLVLMHLTPVHCTPNLLVLHP